MDELIVAQLSTPGQTQTQPPSQPQVSTPGQVQTQPPSQVQTPQPVPNTAAPSLNGAWLVFIGALIPIIGNIVTQVILSRKEQRQWENQQVAEKQAWIRSEKVKEKEYLRGCLKSRKLR